MGLGLAHKTAWQEEDVSFVGMETNQVIILPTVYELQVCRKSPLKELLQQVRILKAGAPFSGPARQAPSIQWLPG